MNDRFLGCTPDQIIATLLAALPPGSTVRVGEEALGIRNVGVDVPRCPRGSSPAVYRRLLGRALEGAGVVVAPMALAPRVEGQIRGSVRTSPAGPTPIDWRRG